MTERLLLKPAEAADAMGIGRSKVYELIASGTIPSVKVGGSTRVPLAQLREWIDRHSRVSEVPSEAGTFRVEDVKALPGDDSLL